MMICKTKYPVLFVHGLGFRDRKWINYWGRIPKALIKNGAEIFYGGQDAWGNIEDNAVTIRNNLLRALKISDTDKINIIAHSKGGLDVRFMISRYGLEEKIASVTTISTPHNGSKTMDYLYNSLNPAIKFTAFFVNIWFRILGDKKPDFYNTCREMTTDCCMEFNKKYEANDNFYRQSYASLMKNSLSDILFVLPHYIIKKFDGENDGIVGINSTVWGEFRGVFRGKKNRGISHADIVDFRRMNFQGTDVRLFYIDIVSGLKNMGY